MGPRVVRSQEASLYLLLLFLVCFCGVLRRLDDFVIYMPCIKPSTVVDRGQRCNVVRVVLSHAHAGLMRTRIYAAFADTTFQLRTPKQVVQRFMSQISLSLLFLSYMVGCVHCSRKVLGKHRIYCGTCEVGACALQWTDAYTPHYLALRVQGRHSTCILVTPACQRVGSCQDDSRPRS